MSADDTSPPSRPARTAAESTPTGAPPRRPSTPSPAVLVGRTDPARRVRPVDWSADGSASRAQDSPSAKLPVRGADGTTGATGATGADGATRAAGAGAESGGSRRARTIELPRPAAPPPPEAVHSLLPEDPRPNPRPLRIEDAQIRSVGVDDLRSEEIVLAVADPEDAWTADAGISDHYLRGGLVVQVRRADNAVIGAFSARYALSVRPEDYQPALDIADDAAGPSARGGRGTRHPTTRRELMTRMQEAGFVIAPGSTHGRVSHPDHPGLFVPFASTPSDRRFTRHAVAQIRRVFGIDLRR